MSRRYVLSTEQMREYDARTVQELIPVEELMETAGEAVYEEIRARVPLPGSLLVVAGRGNNGGDGVVVARRADSEGYEVSLCILAEGAEQLSPPAAAALEKFVFDGGAVQFITNPKELPDHSKFNCSVDSIFGTGFRGPAKGLYAAATGGFARAKLTISVDIPSGLDGDTGQPAGPTVKADVTVALAFEKRGHHLLPGRELTGELVVKPIGIPPKMAREGRADFLYDAAEARSDLPRRPVDAHKKSVGQLGIVSGSRDYTGAPLLVGEGALRAGAGVTFLGLPSSILPWLAGRRPELILVPLPEEEGAVGPGAAEALRERVPGMTALAVGPGLSRRPGVVDAVMELAAMEAPKVLDADALWALSQTEEAVSNGVLTPHSGELARLLGLSAEEVAADYRGAAASCAEKYRAVVLAKGPTTVVVGRDGRAAYITAGTPALAKGGTGDVLTGVIGALLCQGVEPFGAASLGAYLVGRAGELAAGRFGTLSVTPSDTAASVGDVVRELSE